LAFFQLYQPLGRFHPVTAGIRGVESANELGVPAQSTMRVIGVLLSLWRGGSAAAEDDSCRHKKNPNSYFFKISQRIPSHQIGRFE
jgi:hypothetical protein